MLAVAYGGLAFAEKHGLETYDVMDAKGTAVVLWTFSKSTHLARLVRLGVYGCLYLAPIASRKFLGVKPTVHPLAIGMLASAYTQLAEMAPNAIWRDRAKSLLEWLTKNTIPTPTGEAWGGVFPWFSYGGVIPVTTGNAHENMWMANAFFSYFLLTRERWALEHATQACNYLAYCLHSTQHPSGSISKSYTPMDNSQCININADIASILIRLGNQNGDEDFVTIGTGTLRFTLETQRNDGSWSYDMPVRGQRWAPNIDGFHTGMVLSALAAVTPIVRAREAMLADQCQTALIAGLAFYMTGLFTENGQPMYAVNKRYPIDPYSCAQAMITLLDICNAPYLDNSIRDKAEDLLHRVADQTIRIMLEPDGSFLTARYRFRKMRLRSLRWAQAVISLAFLRYSQFLVCRLNPSRNYEPLAIRAEGA